MLTNHGQSPGIARHLYPVKRWMYRGDRPGRLARILNRLSALQFSAGVLSPTRATTLEVRGRKTGRLITFPVVLADYEGERYLVAMLGNEANWVKNVRATGGRASLRRGSREDVTLIEVAIDDRPPILRRVNGHVDVSGGGHEKSPPLVAVSVGGCRGGSSFGAGLFHAERFAGGGDDDGVVEEPVEEADGGGVFGEEPAPFFERPVGSDAK